VLKKFRMIDSVILKNFLSRKFISIVIKCNLITKFFIVVNLIIKKSSPCITADNIEFNKKIKIVIPENITLIIYSSQNYSIKIIQIVRFICLFLALNKAISITNLVLSYVLKKYNISIKPTIQNGEANIIVPKITKITFCIRKVIKINHSRFKYNLLYLKKPIKYLWKSIVNRIIVSKEKYERSNKTFIIVYSDLNKFEVQQIMSVLRLFPTFLYEVQCSINREIFLFIDNLSYIYGKHFSKFEALPIIILAKESMFLINYYLSLEDIKSLINSKDYIFYFIQTYHQKIRASAKCSPKFVTISINLWKKIIQSSLMWKSMIIFRQVETNPLCNKFDFKYKNKNQLKRAPLESINIAKPGTISYTSSVQNVRNYKFLVLKNYFMPLIKKITLQKSLEKFFSSLEKNSFVITGASGQGTYRYIKAYLIFNNIRTLEIDYNKFNKDERVVGTQNDIVNEIDDKLFRIILITNLHKYCSTNDIFLKFIKFFDRIYKKIYVNPSPVLLYKSLDSQYMIGRMNLNVVKKKIEYFHFLGFSFPNIKKISIMILNFYTHQTLEVFFSIYFNLERYKENLIILLLKELFFRHYHYPTYFSSICNILLRLLMQKLIRKYINY